MVWHGVPYGAVGVILRQKNGGLMLLKVQKVKQLSGNTFL